MTTIFRVKRHRAEDPLEALIFSYKRKKTEDSDSEDSCEKVLNFSGTVEAKDNFTARRAVLSFKKKSKYSNFIKNHAPNIRVKQRKERKERREGNISLLLNSLRSMRYFETPEEELKDLRENYSFVDFIMESDDKQLQQDRSDGCYVYDLYSLDNCSDIIQFLSENTVSLRPVTSEYKYQKEEDCNEEADPDEDDSNDENNWRNDYPDTESSMEDEDDDLLARKLKGCHLGTDEFELSGDSGEEEYLNYNDGERYYYYEAEDLAGKRYANYKANAIKQIIGNNYETDPDTSETEDDFCDCEALSYHGDSD